MAVVSPLRIPADSFVGRDEETATLVGLLQDARLVTLTGLAGVGKTRLALHAAAQVTDSFPDGMHLVELAPVRDPALVPQSVAGALRSHEQPNRAVTDTLLGHLRHQRLLLVLDNAEHVVDACAELAQAIVGSCPGVTLLVTSQEPLGVGGEKVLTVAPVALSSAVGLFIDRARAARPDFEATPEAVPVVEEICRRLDGIPLAIELAAARASMLSVEQIAARLGERFDLLTAGRRTMPERHHSLRAAIDWSHGLLSDEEATLLRRLTVFAGSFALDAVEEVCAGGGLGRKRLLHLVGSLLSRSLVIADANGSEARYRLLETIRLYAAERLAEAGEQASLRSGHAQWCLTLAAFTVYFVLSLILRPERKTNSS